jgi:hypothetical protein
MSYIRLNRPGINRAGEGVASHATIPYPPRYKIRLNWNLNENHSYIDYNT